MRTAPRYLVRPSENNAVFNVIAPGSDDDFEEGAHYLLAPLAGMSWRLGQRRRAVLAGLSREWRCDATMVKLHVLRLALPSVLKFMYEERRVRFGATWLRDDEGEIRTLRPGPDLGHVRAADGSTSYCLDSSPSADDVDAFGRWIEQSLLGEARRLLDERVDILNDARQWHSGLDAHDALTRAVSLGENEEVAALVPDGLIHQPDAICLALREYEEATCALARTGLEIDAILDLLNAIHAGAPAWSRNHQRRRDRLAMHLRQLVGAHPEIVALVRRAWEAADILGEAGVTLPAVG